MALPCCLCDILGLNRINDEVSNFICCGEEPFLRRWEGRRRAGMSSEWIIPNIGFQERAAAAPLAVAGGWDREGRTWHKIQSLQWSHKWKIGADSWWVHREFTPKGK